MMSGMQREAARYDLIRDFYLHVVGMEFVVGDLTAAALLDLLGDVRGTRVLDLACGHGRITREIARRGAQVAGVDISDVLLEMAQAAEIEEPLGITYLKADVTSDQALAGETFDEVACSQGLGDIDDLDGALATVARVLRPGGRFVFSILHPCFPGWDEDAPSSWPHRPTRRVGGSPGIRAFAAR